ncbi:hypothetical protein JTE90_023437 [Oedothorax gibbosus]|uniref:Helitron helicase-like domain-containing protein n=1 Tax=Oedothorax gibbosus TaxID=931172 RepID=A0AAV6TZK7_9ARAC|nr:hypothetical protein JTE90_023437 [Oedothorax gibbosus]
MSPMQYYGHRLALRSDEPFNPLLNAERLTQQYIINSYVLVEPQRLDYIRYNQSTLHAECYQGMVDHVEKNALNVADEVRLGHSSDSSCKLYSFSKMFAATLSRLWPFVGR